MFICEALSDEAEVIAGFQLKLAKETENLDLDFEIVRKGVKAVFDDPSKGKYYVAIEDDAIIACILTTFEWSDWRNATVVWLQSLYVRYEFRRKGVFRLFYLYIKNEVMKKPDLKGIRLYVDLSNQVAINAYESIGMNGEHYKLFEWMKSND